MVRTFSFLILGISALGFLLYGGQGQAQSENGWILTKSIEVQRVSDGLRVDMSVRKPTRGSVTGTLELTLIDLDKQELSSVSKTIRIFTKESRISALIPLDLEADKIPLTLLRYELETPSHEESGSRSLAAVMAQLETRVIGYDSFIAGSEGGIRVVALNHATGQPVRKADITISLEREEGQKETLFEGTTNSEGTVDATFEIPEDVETTATLIIEVDSETLGKDEQTHTVRIKKKSRILLTTDKPLYQPGQTIHIRALCLKSFSLDAESEKDITLEVMDSKGNKVYKKMTQTDEFGIAATDFQLATEVNEGPYIIRAILGPSQMEKQVNVEKYVLPKFEIEVTTDKEYYLPGETLKGQVQTDYFFGKPVSGGQVEIIASKFEISFEQFAEIQGKLDADGHYEFELELPDYFAGTPIEQGKASVRLQVRVTDTADHLEEKVVMKPVAEAALSVFAIPESGSLIPNLDNQVFLLVAYPDGTPAENAKVIVRSDIQGMSEKSLTTDGLGIATFTVKPEKDPTVTLKLSVSDRQGESVSKEIILSAEATAESLILRTNKALYEVGNTIEAQALTTKETGTAYFDLIREGQTVLTKAADISAGQASISLDIDATMFGSLTLQAYVFTPGTDLIRDTRLLYVNPADSLSISIDKGQDVFKPGEKANIRFKVSDESGNGTVAALGISIVDESVFALQEMHPGLEKIYFTLEKEIMKPRYEIHGYEMGDIIQKPAVPREEDEVGIWSDEQQEAARVLLASAPKPQAPPVQLNSYQAKQGKAADALWKHYEKDYQHVQKAVLKYLQKSKHEVPDNFIDVLLREKYLRPNEILDPWGNEYEFDFTLPGAKYGHFKMLSYGPDEIKGTADDLSREGRRFGAPRRRLGMGIEVMEDMRFDAAIMKAPEAKAIIQGEADAPSATAEEPVRLREYFPETLLFEPALITNSRGEASLEFDMADSITTWRMTTMASTSGGLLGSKDSPIRVFQDFFVDIDLPVALTQNDEVSIPVVLYNYLDGQQKVRLKFDKEPWFEMEGEPERTIQLKSEEVLALYFPIKVKEIGHHRLTVWAYGEKMSDAIRREIEVRPDGEEQNITFSDRLSGDVSTTVDIPSQAIDGASKILVRIYPGVFSQIVDGLDSMLRMPTGCFEQTSSATYPNILIVQYMKETNQINPETQIKAEGFINTGYQRLLAYEVDGGGFSWFGDAPANKVLTAYGLKEFHDMSEVHEVDQNVIARTRSWLLSKQESDGSWKPDESYLHAESWSTIQKNNVLVTAYILESILSTGWTGEAADKAVNYLRQNWKGSDDPYVLATLANSLVTWDRSDAWTVEVLESLHDMKKVEDEVAYWESEVGTVTFSTGEAANIETTAMAAIAFLKAGRYPETTGQALTYLIRQKSAQGSWGSTQATILALKALTLSAGSGTQEVNATIVVSHNGEKRAELEITPDTSDVMRLVDLGEYTVEGSNEVQLKLTGEGSMLYQIVGRYYIPWSLRREMPEPMSIDIAYDKTELAVNDIVTATVKVKNNRPETAQMIIVDLGIPPGFQVRTPDLHALVEDKTMQKFELTGRQIICYFEQIGGNETIEFSYKLQAKFPLRAKTPESKVYEYYNPDISNTADPEEMVVE